MFPSQRGDIPDHGFWGIGDMSSQNMDGRAENQDESNSGSLGLYDLPPPYAGNTLQAPFMGDRRTSSAPSYTYTDPAGGYANPGHPISRQTDNVGSRLIDHPVLYRQLFPPAILPLSQSSSASSDIPAIHSGTTINPSLHLSRSYTRPPTQNQAHRAHHALREAVSQPDFSPSVIGVRVRHTPYPRPVGHRSVSNNSYLPHSGQSQALRSRGSTAFQPIFSTLAGNDPTLGPQASFSSTTTTDQPPLTPDPITCEFDDPSSISRFHHLPQGFGYNPYITHSQPEPLISNPDIGEMGVQPHLFMSGLGLPGGVGGNGQVQGVIDDESAWRGIRGKGIGGVKFDGDASDDEEEEEDSDDEEEQEKVDNPVRFTIGSENPANESESGSDEYEDNDVQQEEEEEEYANLTDLDLDLSQLQPRYPLLKQYTVSPSPFPIAASLPPSPRIQSGISETRPNVSDSVQVRESVRLGKGNGLMVDIDEEEEEGGEQEGIFGNEVKGSYTSEGPGKGRRGTKSKGKVGKGERRPAKKTKTVRKRRGGRMEFIKTIKSGQSSTTAGGHGNTLELEVVEEEPDSVQVGCGNSDIRLASPPPSALVANGPEESQLELQQPYTQLSIHSGEPTEDNQTGLDKVDEEDEEVEVEEAYHPSGRPMRATTKRQVQPIKTHPVDLGTSGDEAEGGEEQDDWADEIDSDSISFSSVEHPLRQVQQERQAHRSRARTPAASRGRTRVKMDNTKEGDKKPRVDPEVMIRVEGLRGRLIGKGSQSGIFDEKLCQLMVDSRFTPKYIRWDTKGEKFVIPDFKAFFDTAVPYVMTRPSDHWGGFEKQLSNHGWKRETTVSSSTDIVTKTLLHPQLRKDDLELWDKVRDLPELMKWGKGNPTGIPRQTLVDTLRRDKRELKANLADEKAKVELLQEQVNRYEVALRFVAAKDLVWWKKNAAAMGLSKIDLDRFAKPGHVNKRSPKRTQAAAEEDELDDDDVKVDLDAGVKKGEAGEENDGSGSSGSGDTSSSSSSGSSGSSGSEPTCPPPSPLVSINEIPDISPEQPQAHKKRSRDGLKVGQTQIQTRTRARGEGEGEGCKKAEEGKGGVSEDSEDSEEEKCVWGMIPGKNGRSLGKKRSRVVMRGKK